ncbi:uncharacterized protein LOC128983145 [Macrosteles quadrilineatus]|uniref:uncharacterized protein LOC128983145 n=1 Tax=Macrosteles quadrilineatus TaxID=74068 RepID=UPI0023E161D4|nr:uncharacterized protein LOC128983145 [Macrosteles quadrilineatus]
MVSKMSIVSLLIACMIASAMAQRSPYAGASDPGVLPQYLPKDENNRFGADSAPLNPGTPAPALHPGTLETEALYNRVQSWPDDKKPFWFLNSQALDAQRKKQQQQQAQLEATKNRQSPFAAGSKRKTN